jgi:transcriptional regulator with XRE-family HTH domain
MPSKAYFAGAGMAMKRARRQIDLVNRIRQLREQRGWSQGDLADRANLSQTYLSRIEAARRPGSIRALRQIATALEVGISELFERDGREQLIMALLDELDRDQQEQALVMLEAYVKGVKTPKK